MKFTEVKNSFIKYKYKNCKKLVDYFECPNCKKRMKWFGNSWSINGVSCSCGTVFTTYDLEKWFIETPELKDKIKDFIVDFDEMFPKFFPNLIFLTLIIILGLIIKIFGA